MNPNWPPSSGTSPDSPDPSYQDATGEWSAVEPDAQSDDDTFEFCATVARYERREELLERFAKWLDVILEHEEPPTGAEAELLEALEAEETDDTLPLDGHDQFAMWSALTSLTQEVRIQGRTFKELADRLDHVQLPDPNALSESIAKGLSPELSELFRAVREEAFQQVDRARSETKAAVRSEAIKTLLDMRDRLERGLTTSKSMENETPSPPKRRRWSFWGRVPQPVAEPSERITALTQGYQMSLERLDETLRGWGVQEIPCESVPFDPNHMRVAEVHETDTVSEGTVTAVIRRGYLWKEKPFRTALVQVAKRPSRSLTDE